MGWSYALGYGEPLFLAPPQPSPAGREHLKDTNNTPSLQGRAGVGLKTNNMRYSIIIPVYNRPDELDELLYSLERQIITDFEVIVVEDGSQICSDKVCEKASKRLNLRYLKKENGGPGPARNFGAAHAQGDYLIILDSDVVLPVPYLDIIERDLNEQEVDAFGGPDRAHPSFTPVQKAISYSMTAFFTTGGIRGGRKKLDRFFPRSFNMGIRRSVYEALGGFAKMRFGEDVDFSYRIIEAGYSCRLFPEAWVWHKRRTDFRKFFRQVFNSGIARINLEKRHPHTLKLVHLLPTVFLLGCIFLIVAALLSCSLWPLLPLLLYALLVFVDSFLQNWSLKVALLSIPAAYIQLCGYGAGFLQSWWRRCILKKEERGAFEKTFYK